MDLSMKDIGLTIYNKVMEKNTGLMDLFMKENISKEWKMAKEMLLFPMAVNLLENLSIIKLKGIQLYYYLNIPLYLSIIHKMIFNFEYLNTVMLWYL